MASRRNDAYKYDESDGLPGIPTQALCGPGTKPIPEHSTYPVDEEFLTAIGCQFVPRTCETEVEGAILNCENCKEDGVDCRYVCFTFAHDHVGIDSKACIRCERTGKKDNCRIISIPSEIATEAGKAGARLYAGETPEASWWDTTEKGMEVTKQGDARAEINFKHRSRCLAIHRLNLSLGFDKPNPAIYGHDTMTAKEQEWARKHQAERKMHRIERQEVEKFLRHGAGDEVILARFDTPPPFVSEQDIDVHDLNYLRVHGKSYFADHNPFAGRSSTGPPRAPRPRKTAEEKVAYFAEQWTAAIATHGVDSPEAEGVWRNLEAVRATALKRKRDEVGDREKGF